VTLDDKLTFFFLNLNNSFSEPLFQQWRREIQDINVFLRHAEGTVDTDAWISLSNEYNKPGSIYAEFDRVLFNNSTDPTALALKSEAAKALEHDQGNFYHMLAANNFNFQKPGQSSAVIGAGDISITVNNTRKRIEHIRFPTLLGLKPDKALADKVREVLGQDHGIDRTNFPDKTVRLEALIEGNKQWMTAPEIDAYDKARAEYEATVKLDILSPAATASGYNRDLFDVKEDIFANKLDDLNEKLEQYYDETTFPFDYDPALSRQRKGKRDKKGNVFLSRELEYNDIIRQLGDMPYGPELPAAVARLSAAHFALHKDNNVIAKYSKDSFVSQYLALSKDIGKKLAEKAAPDTVKEIVSKDKFFSFLPVTEKIERDADQNLLVDTDKTLTGVRSWLSDANAALDRNIKLLQEYENNTALQSIVPQKPAKNISVKKKVRYYQERLINALKQGKLRPDVAEHRTLVNTLGRVPDSAQNAYQSFVNAYVDSLDISDEDKKILKESKTPLSVITKKAESSVDAADRKKALQKLAANSRLNRDALAGYRQLSGKQPDTGLSYFDQVNFFRKNLAGQAADLVENGNIRNKGILDLALRDSALKAKAADRLAASLGFNAEEKQSLLRGNVPLYAWEQKAADRAAIRDKVMSADTSHADFVAMMADKNNRRALERTTVKRGKQNKQVIAGISWFQGVPYRDVADKALFEQAVSSVLDPLYAGIRKQQERIAAARKPVIEAQVNALETKDSLSDKEKERLTKLKEQLSNLSRDPVAWLTDDTIVKGYDSKKKTAERILAETTARADILSLDPHYNVKKLLEGIAREDTVSALQSVIPSLQELRYKVDNQSSLGFTAPAWVGRQSLDVQFDWWSNALRDMTVIRKLDRPGFDAWLDGKNTADLKKSLPVGVLTFFDGNVYRNGIDNTSAIERIKELRRQRKQRLIASEVKAKATKVSQDTVNDYGLMVDKVKRRTETAVEDARAVAALSTDEFAEGYFGLAPDAKRAYDRNFGKPLFVNGTPYRDMYEMPDDVWAAYEEQRGVAFPRQREKPVLSYDIDEEKLLQDKITADLQSRSWKPVRPKKTEAAEITVADTAPEESPVQQKVQQLADRPTAATEAANKAAHNNLRRMFEDFRRNTRSGTIGAMGMAASISLFNLATSGPSKEALEHRRRIEEQRRIAMYGY